MTIGIHAPPNKIQSIDEIWAAVSSDETGEGLCSIILGGVCYPLIAADLKRLEWVTEQAAMLAATTGKAIKVIKLSQRTELTSFRGGRQ